MKFSTREDIKAPIEAVFSFLEEFETYERAAMRRGAEVHRRHEPEGKLGTLWDVRYFAKGKYREFTCRITRFDPPSDLMLEVQSENVAAFVHCELFALSRSRTRMVLSVELKPVSLSARLFIQSLRLTKTKLTRQFKDKVSEYVSDIENNYRRNG